MPTQFTSRTHARENDDDGVFDPELDGALNVGSEESKSGDSDEAKELETGESITPIRQWGTDDGSKETELDLGHLLDEPATTPHDENLDGPISDRFLDLDPELELDDAAMDEGEGTFDDDAINENLPNLDWEEETRDEKSPGTLADVAVDFNDVAIPWASQPWSEQKLRTAFVARQCINARRNILIAVGDAIDFLSLEDFTTLDSNPPTGKARFASFLDSTCKSVLVLKATGKLVVWNRESASFEVDASLRFRDIDRVADVWIAPSGNQLWIRLDTGQLLGNADGSFKPVALPGRCVAMGGNDEALLCLVRQTDGLSLVAVYESSFKILSVASELSDLSEARSISLVTLGQVVLVIARGYGLWLSTDGGVTFRKAPGCRDVTACTLGNFSGRIYAWASLFYELEDRAELVGIDLRASRVHKLAEYRVMSDSMGPEDDPPERARIDCLLWDSTRQRILAAGCFGLACFVPPQSTNPTS